MEISSKFIITCCPELVLHFSFVCNTAGSFVGRPFILEVRKLVLTYPKFDLGPRNFLSTRLSLALGLCTRLSSSSCWVNCLDMETHTCHHQIPSRDPFRGGELTLLMETFHSVRRCHCTLGVGSFSYSLAVKSFFAIHFFSGHKEKDHLWTQVR